MTNKTRITIQSYSKIAKQTGSYATKVLKICARFLILFFLSFFLILLFWGMGKFFEYSKEFESIAPKSKSTQLVILDRDESEIYRGYGAAEPDRVALSEMPREVIEATLAAEDINFYKHGPIDSKSIIRAIYFNYLNSDASGFDRLLGLFTENNYNQGGSTITQQLVKNIYLTDEKSFERKIKEAVFSYKLEEKYTKDQILEMYLNEIYYGEQALGIKNAAKIYFNKEISSLNLAEISMLAGLPQAPTFFSPISGNEIEAKKRQEYVLQQMYLAKMIDLETAKASANEPLVYCGELKLVDKYPYFSQYVKEEITQKLGIEEVDGTGLTVYSSLDTSKQVVAEQRIKENLKKLAYRGASNAAAVIGNVEDGTILAMVGGADWSKSKVNVATSLRQPGSSFKPVVYATGLENGYTAATILVDKYVNYGGTPPYIPKNYNGGYSGYVTVRNALARSLNTTAVEMGQLVGIEKVIDTAHDLGITSINNSPSEYGLSLSLGSAEVRLVDMVEAYSVFADNGKRTPLSSILKIVSNDNNEVNLPSRNKLRVISEETGYIITSILSDNKARATTFGSNSPLKTNNTTAVKTGTTDNYNDSWTVGYSPDYVVGVWVGNNDHTPMKQVSGIEGAAYVWHDIITDITLSVGDKPFAKPANIKEAWINPYTGGIASYNGGGNVLEYFKEGSVPNSTRPDLGYLKIFQ